MAGKKCLTKYTKITRSLRIKTSQNVRLLWASIAVDWERHRVSKILIIYHYTEVKKTMTEEEAE